MKFIFLIFITLTFFSSAFGQEVVKNECDFSKFSPIQIRHFSKDSVILQVKPDYPKRAIKKKIIGNVSVKVLINEEGLVEKACMVTGNEVFRKAAEKAALKWKFKPGYGFAFTLPEKVGQKRYAFAIIAFVFNREFE